ncbi:MAG TPA: isopentenyl-diphosphate Delta-isomerase [Micrococcaceae bacterium]|nr:isopentenyl-diphosphate Delta-isomerase [Micrococcaceae bacterium]
MTVTPELVSLVDDDGRRLGTAAKDAVHTTSTPLHLAFSCHLFDNQGRTLVTRRALSKKTWPGVWTNSFCGHPAPDEPLPSAIARRAEQELGITVSDPESVLPEFRYRAVDASGIVENELCPVFYAKYPDGSLPLEPNPLEVCDWAWVRPADLEQAAKLAPFAFSPWLVLQLEQGLYSRTEYPRGVVG